MFKLSADRPIARQVNTACSRYTYRQIVNSTDLTSELGLLNLVRYYSHLQWRLLTCHFTRLISDSLSACLSVRLSCTYSHF